ncbi:MAG: polysaccharide biosynthesis/export family protein [bacterium]
MVRKDNILQIVFLLVIVFTSYSISEYILGPQDLLYISVYPVFVPLPQLMSTGTSLTQVTTGVAQQQYTIGGNVRVDADGDINLYLAGRIHVTGMTPSMLEIELERRYADYLIEPDVVVTVEKPMNARYIICGEVRVPGVYVVDRDISILEAIVSAGGFLRTGLRYDVKVIRGGLEKPELISCNLDEVMKEGNVKDNIKIQPGDIIFVPKTLLTRLNEVIEDLRPALSAIITGGNIYDMFKE